MGADEAPPARALPRSPGRTAARTALAIVSLLGATAVALAPPYLVGRAVDEVQQRRHAAALAGSSPPSSRPGVLGIAFSYAQTYFTGWTGERMLADLRNHLFRHLQRLSLGFYERNRAGVIISRLTNDVEALDQLVTDGVTLARPEHADAASAPRSSSSSSTGGWRSRR